MTDQNPYGPPGSPSDPSPWGSPAGNDPYAAGQAGDPYASGQQSADPYAGGQQSAAGQQPGWGPAGPGADPYAPGTQNAGQQPWGQPDPAPQAGWGTAPGQSAPTWSADGAPAWSAQGAPMPGAPRPGTDLGADLGASFRWMWSAFVANIGAFLIPAVVYGLITLGLALGPILLEAIVMAAMYSDDYYYSPTAPLWTDAVRLLGSILSAVASLLWSTGAYRAAGIARAGRRPSLAESFIGSGPLILASLLVGVIVAVGGIFCLIPGLVLAVLSIYTLPAVAEGRGVTEALSESFRMVRDHVGVSILAMLIFLAAGVVGGTLVVGVFVLVPLGALFVTALHHRLSGRELTQPARIG